MSVAQDVRQVLQDFLAPELRAINARLDALEKLQERIHKGQEQPHQEIKELRTETLSSIRGVADYTHVLERLSRLEAQRETRQ